MDLAGLGLDEPETPPAEPVPASPPPAFADAAVAAPEMDITDFDTPDEQTAEPEDVAAMRALRLYARSRATGRTIAWDKTEHVYPSEEELLAYRRRLGDLLLDKRFVTVAQLDAALDRQKKTGEPLGEALLALGLVSQDTLVQVLGLQFRLETREIDPYLVPLDAIAALPQELAALHEVFPLEIEPDGALSLAVNQPLSRQTLTELEAAAGRPLRLYLATKSDLSFAIRRGFKRLEQADAASLKPLDRLLHVVADCRLWVPDWDASSYLEGGGGLSFKYLFNRFDYEVERSSLEFLLQYKYGTLFNKINVSGREKRISALFLTTIVKF